MDPFLGEVRLFAGTFAPVGWALCDGSLLPISENDALYSLIGTTYGGDGQSTFAVPDLRGRVPIHQDHGANVPGVTGGQESVTLAPANLVSHSHALIVSTTASGAVLPTGALLAASPADVFVYRETPATVALSAAAIGGAGGGAAHENRQPYQVLTYIIATAGIFPPQN